MNCFQNQKKVGDFGLNVNFFKYRPFDPQIGRGWQIDPKVDEGQHSFTPYHYSFNNTIRFSDPDGLMGEPCCGEIGAAVGGFFEGVGQAVVRNVKAVTVNLPETLQGMATSLSPLGQYQTAVGVGMVYEKTKSDWNSGDTRTRANIVGNVVGEVGIAVAGTKGAGSLGKAGAVAEVAKVGEASELAGAIRNINAVRGGTNCVNCAIATDATLAGRPASALNSVPQSLSVLEKEFGGKFTHGLTVDKVKSMVGESGQRGVVFGSRGSGQVGHVFNVVNQKGVVRFLDGQTGKAADLSGYKNFSYLPTK